MIQESQHCEPWLIRGEEQTGFTLVNDVYEGEKLSGSALLRLVLDQYSPC